MSYSSYRRVKKLNTGGEIGSALATGATSLIPGVGPALAPLGGMIGRGIGSLLDKEKEIEPTMRSAYMKNGGKLKYATGGGLPITRPIGNGAVKYEGNKHEQGGIPIDGQGNPTNPDNATAEVEDNETRQGDYIFSADLKVPGTDLTFAQAHEKLISEGADEAQIEQLAQLQEQTKQKGGMSQSQNWNQKGAVTPMNDGGTLPFSKKKLPTTSSLTDAPSKERGSFKTADSNSQRFNPTFGKKKTNFGEAMSNIGVEDVQRALPSLTRLGVAAFAPKPKSTKPISPQRVRENNPAFNEASKSIAAGFRANPDQGGYAQYTNAMNRLTASKAQDTLQREQINARSTGRADEINQRVQMRDADVKSRDTATRLKLIQEAIELPADMAAADKRGLQQQIAQALTSADTITDQANWEQRVHAKLTALGLDESRIKEIISKFRP